MISSGCTVNDSTGGLPIRRTSPFLCLLILLGQILSCPLAMAKVVPRDPNHLIAVIPHDAPPTYFQDPQTGEPAGFSIDLTNEVAKQAGLTLSYTFANSWEEIQQLIQRGDADLMPGLSVSAGRQEHYSFSKPFDIFTISFFVHSGIDSLKANAKVGVIKESVAHELLLGKTGLLLIPYMNFETGLFDLLSGKIDSFACPTPVFWRLAMDTRVDHQITIVGEPIAEVKRALGVRKGRTDLVARLNKVLDTFASSPEYQAIYTKWYGKPKPYFALSKPKLWLIMGSSLAIGLLLLWRHFSLLTVARQLLRESEEREKTAVALQVSEERLRLTLAATQQGWFDLDIPTGVVKVSQEYPKILGYTPEEFHTNLQDWMNAIHPEDRDAVLQAFNDCLNDGEARSMEYRRRSKTGDWVWLRSTGKVIEYDAVRKPLRMIGTHVDISKFKETSAALRESEARYRELFEAESDAIFLLDNEVGQILQANTAAIALYGYDKEELLAKKNTDLSAEPEDTRLRTQEGVEKPHQILNIPVRLHRKKDGTVFPVEITARSFLLQGRSVHIAAIRDITERQLAVDAMKKSEEHLLRALKEKEVLIKEVHHRVKNNMQVIYSLLNLQAKGITDPLIRSMFEESRNRVNSMALIHEKLYQSKDLAFIDFKEYLQRLSQEIAGTYNRPEVRLSVVMEDCIELDVNVGIPCGLIANELISNSFKHAFPQNRQGSIQVGMDRTGESDCVLTVSDNGIGFPAGLDFRNTPSLGLQLANVLTGQLQGSITLSSEPGTTIYRITFPVSQQQRGRENG